MKDDEVRSSCVNETLADLAPRWLFSSDQFPGAEKRRHEKGAQVLSCGKTGEQCLSINQKIRKRIPEQKKKRNGETSATPAGVPVSCSLSPDRHLSQAIDWNNSPALRCIPSIRK